MKEKNYRELEIPERCFPSESYNTTKVFRVVKDENNIGIKDFLPTIIEYEQRQRKAGKNLSKLRKVAKRNDCEQYACSVFEDLNKMINQLAVTGVLRHKKGIVVGRVDLKKGKTTVPDIKSHISYYLYDYVNKNPYLDFSVYGRVEDYLK